MAKDTETIMVESAVLIDENRLFRNALRLMLEGEGLRVAAELDVIDEAIAKPEEIAGADVILLRANKVSTSYGAISRLKEVLGEAKVVLLADAEVSPESMLAGITSGADGVLLSELSTDAFLQSLRLVRLGEKVLPARLTAMLMGNNFENRLMPKEVREIGLSDREIQILELLAGGFSNKEIAIRLDIAEATVKVHVKAVLRKIRVGNRTQAAVWALGHGLAAKEC